MRVVGLPPLGTARAAPLTMLAPGLPVSELLPEPEVAVASQLTSLLADSAISSTADDLAGSLFGASLFPWLAMLYWLRHPTVAAPPGVAFGLTFLLAFVFGTIPAAIGAGALYGVSLADADYLHGANPTYHDCSTTTIDHSNQTAGYYPCLNPDVFNPTDLDAEDWMAASAAMGTKEICLTAHHEGASRCGHPTSPTTP